MFCLYLSCTYTTYVLSARGVQKTALDSLKLKLEMTMSCHVGTGH